MTVTADEAHPWPGRRVQVQDQSSRSYPSTCSCCPLASHRAGPGRAGRSRNLHGACGPSLVMLRVSPRSEPGHAPSQSAVRVWSCSKSAPARRRGPLGGACGGSCATWAGPDGVGSNPVRTHVGTGQLRAAFLPAGSPGSAGQFCPSPGRPGAGSLLLPGRNG